MWDVKAQTNPHIGHSYSTWFWKDSTNWTGLIGRWINRCEVSIGFMINKSVLYKAMTLMAEILYVVFQPEKA